MDQSPQLVQTANPDYALVQRWLAGEVALHLISPDQPAPPLPTLPAGVTLALQTSGSTGEPKTVLHTTASLVASARTTNDFLGDPGQWLLTLPTHHIAGFQVLLRSVLAGIAPEVLPGPFRARTFAELAGSQQYVSLVPTQLSRILPDDAARAALATFSAVLVGGAGLPEPLAAAAAEANIKVVHTYGMSETGGGLVYDGRPLPGAEVALDSDGRILLGGPFLAHSYLEDHHNSAFRTTGGGTRWLATNDWGSWQDGRLQVSGRLDNLINTGGEKIAPEAVERALESLPEVAGAVVVGQKDSDWGQKVVALVVWAGPKRLPKEQLGAAVRAGLGPAAVPRVVVEATQLPLLPTGKIDRQAAAALLEYPDPGRLVN